MLEEVSKLLEAYSQAILVCDFPAPTAPSHAWLAFGVSW